MRLDVAKIDERIKKLQEIRRIATDPEMTAILVDCLITEDPDIAPRLAERREELPEIDGFPQSPANANDAAKDEADELLKSFQTGMSWRRSRA